MISCYLLGLNEKFTLLVIRSTIWAYEYKEYKCQSLIGVHILIGVFSFAYKHENVRTISKKFEDCAKQKALLNAY